MLSQVGCGSGLSLRALRDAYLGLSLSWKELRCEGEKGAAESLVVSEGELFELFALQHMALVHEQQELTQQELKQQE